MIETSVIAYAAVGVFGINVQYVLLTMNSKLVDQLMLKLERYVNMSTLIQFLLMFVYIKVVCELISTQKLKRMAQRV